MPDDVDPVPGDGCGPGEDRSGAGRSLIIEGDPDGMRAYAAELEAMAERTAVMLAAADAANGQAMEVADRMDPAVAVDLLAHGGRLQAGIDGMPPDAPVRAAAALRRYADLITTARRDSAAADENERRAMAAEDSGGVLAAQIARARIRQSLDDGEQALIDAVEAQRRRIRIPGSET